MAAASNPGKPTDALRDMTFTDGPNEGSRLRDAFAAALQEPESWIACCQASDDEALLAALGFTLGMRLESEVRKRYPALTRLTADTRPAPSTFRRRRGVLQRMSAGA